MSDHLKVNPKDNDTRRSLIALVGKRKDLLKYLSRKDLNKYRKLIAELGLRDTQK
jgi:small subunit ribosomal protein S15